MRGRLELAWERLRREMQGEDDTPRRIVQHEQRLNKWRAAATSAYADMVNDEITRAQYHDIKARAAGEIEDAEQELARLRSKVAPSASLPRLSEVLGFVRGWRRSLEGDDTASHRALL